MEKDQYGNEIARQDTDSVSTLPGKPQELAKAIMDNPTYIVKCYDSDRRAKKIDDAYTIQQITVNHTLGLIRIYYWS